MTDRSIKSALLLIVALCASVLVAAAQTPRSMTLVDLLNVPRLSDPRLSPDGRDVVYVQAQADWKANKRISHLWRVPVAGGRAVQLTTGAEGETTPRWSPDTACSAGLRGCRWPLSHTRSSSRTAPCAAFLI